MLTIDKAKVDEIIDGLLGNNDLTASPEVWYGLHQIKNLPATEIVRCGECANQYKPTCPFGVWINTPDDGHCHWAERRTDENNNLHV